MLRRLLGRVDDGRFGRALAGLQSGWQWECESRSAERVEGVVQYSGKQYMVVIERRGAMQACGVCGYGRTGSRSGGTQRAQAAAGVGALMSLFFGCRVSLSRPPGRSCAPNAATNHGAAARLHSHHLTLPHPQGCRLRPRPCPRGSYIVPHTRPAYWLAYAHDLVPPRGRGPLLRSYVRYRARPSARLQKLIVLRGCFHIRYGAARLHHT